jgi:hypothetical protein
MDAPKGYVADTGGSMDATIAARIPDVLKKSDTSLRGKRALIDVYVNVNR